MFVESSYLEAGEMIFGNAKAEKECPPVEAIINLGLRVSMMRATCNLPSRPWEIIAYPYQGCNRSTDLNSVSNFTHSVGMMELFRSPYRLCIIGIRSENQQRAFKPLCTLTNQRMRPVCHCEVFPGKAVAIPPPLFIATSTRRLLRHFVPRNDKGEGVDKGIVKQSLKNY